MFLWFHKLGSPPHFYRISGKWLPWLGWIFVLLLVAGVSRLTRVLAHLFGWPNRVD